MTWISIPTSQAVPWELLHSLAIAAALSLSLSLSLCLRHFCETHCLSGFRFGDHASLAASAASLAMRASLLWEVSMWAQLQRHEKCSSDIGHREWSLAGSISAGAPARHFWQPDVQGLSAVLACTYIYIYIYIFKVKRLWSGQGRKGNKQVEESQCSSKQAHHQRNNASRRLALLSQNYRAVSFALSFPFFIV